MRGASPEIVIASIVVTGLVSVAAALLAGRFGDRRQRREEAAADRLRRRDLKHARDLVDLEELRRTADDSVKHALRAIAALDDALAALEGDGLDDDLRDRIDQTSARVRDQAWRLLMRRGETGATEAFQELGEAIRDAVNAVEEGNRTTTAERTEAAQGLLKTFVERVQSTVGTPLDQGESAAGAAEDARVITRDRAADRRLTVSALGLGAYLASAAALASVLVVSVAEPRCQGSCDRPVDVLLASAACGLLAALSVGAAAVDRRRVGAVAAAATATAASTLGTIWAIVTLAVDVNAGGLARGLLVVLGGALGLGAIPLATSLADLSAGTRWWPGPLVGAAVGCAVVAVVVVLGGISPGDDAEPVAWSLAGVVLALVVAAGCGAGRLAMTTAGTALLVAETGTLLWLL